MDQVTTASVFTIDVRHRGRAADNDLELATIELLLEEQPGDPLTTAEAEALLERLRIHVDTGSGAYEPANDPLVTSVESFVLAAGVQTVPFPDGEPLAQVLPGQSRRYFAVVELKADAELADPSTLRVTFLAQAADLAQDRSHDVPLTAAHPVNAAARIDANPVSGRVQDLRLFSMEFLDAAPLAGGGFLGLSWSPSCDAGDVGYAVYRGTLGQFTSHVRRNCTVALTEFSEFLFSGEPSFYYLVVPQGECTEGSYGLSTAGERPAASNACLPYRQPDCP
jgi:hypothetical protein